MDRLGEKKTCAIACTGLLMAVIILVAIIIFLQLI